MDLVPVLPSIPARVASRRGKSRAEAPAPFSGWNFPPTPQLDSTETSPTLLDVPLQPEEPISPTNKGFVTDVLDLEQAAEAERPDQPRLPWWRRIPILSWFFEVIAFHFDLRFILKIFDVRSYFWPMTYQKAAYLTVYICIIAAMVTTAEIYHWGTGVFNFLKGSAWPIMVVLICLDPVTAVYYSSIAPVKPLLAESCRPDWEDKETYELVMAAKELQQGRDLDIIGAPALVDSNTAETALIIPCHDSELETTELVLAAALRLFPAQNIFVVENGNSAAPLDRTFQMLGESLSCERLLNRADASPHPQSMLFTPRSTTSGPATATRTLPSTWALLPLAASSTSLQSTTT